MLAIKRAIQLVVFATRVNAAGKLAVAEPGSGFVSARQSFV